HAPDRSPPRARLSCTNADAPPRAARSSRGGASVQEGNVDIYGNTAGRGLGPSRRGVFLLSFRAPLSPLPKRGCASGGRPGHSTVILRDTGESSLILGSVTCSTPLRYWAVMCSSSTPSTVKVLRTDRLP